ncbi:MAG: hypothetical protein EXS13_01750 [Planctomycetes bacterium]|nr:hypothetical protein [Planctomycetota bacterium]
MKEGNDKFELVVRRSADGRVVLTVASRHLDVAIGAGLLEARPLADCIGAERTALGGRGAPVRLRFGRERVIATTLARGGVLGRLLSNGFASTRRLDDLVALQLEIEGRNVPVAPFAFARARRQGGSVEPGVAGSWVLEFATVEQQDGLDAARQLRQALDSGERRALLEAAAAAIRVLHAAGITHADLNATNLLLARAPARAWLIDFGGSTLGAPLAPLAHAAIGNLARLLRSAEKVKLLGAALGAFDLAAFVRGYAAAAGREAGAAVDLRALTRRALFAAVRARYQRSIVWHRLGWRLFGRRSPAR